MIKLCWRLTPNSVISFILLMLIFPLTFWLPIETAIENGPIEWLQVVILAVGCITAFGGFLYGCGRAETRRLFLCSVPVWLLMIGRELSWGRVFFPTENGGFLPLRELWYGAYVYPAIAAVLIGTCFYMLRANLHKELLYLLRNNRFPAIDVMVFVAALVIAHAGERYEGAWLGEMHVVLEETAETVVYFTMVSMMVNLAFYKDFQPQIKRYFLR